jgi:putative transposase
VSRICAELDSDLEAFRAGASTATSPYVFADAIASTGVSAKVFWDRTSNLRQSESEGPESCPGRSSSATRVRADGTREVLGIDIGESEAGAFWTAFFRSLRARGLTGVQLVISDHHSGLKAAIAAVFVWVS